DGDKLITHDKPRIESRFLADRVEVETEPWNWNEGGDLREQRFRDEDRVARANQVVFVEVPPIEHGLHVDLLDLEKLRGEAAEQNDFRQLRLARVPACHGEGLRHGER